MYGSGVGCAMGSVFSQLSTKSQVTLPKPVRETLGLAPGDTLSYEIHEGYAVLRKATSLDVSHLEALQLTLSEWANADDAAAYDDL